MKNFLLVSCAALATLLAGTAHAADNKDGHDKFKQFYVKANGGIIKANLALNFEDPNNSSTHNSISFDTNNGFAGRLSAGYHFYKRFAAELDFGVSHVQDNGEQQNYKVVAYDIFANCCYNFSIDPQFSPYIKAGLGYTHATLSEPGSSDYAIKMNAPTVAVGIGVTYTFLGVFMDINYTFFKYLSAQLKFGSDLDQDLVQNFNTSHGKAIYYANLLTLGIGFRF